VFSYEKPRLMSRFGGKRLSVIMFSRFDTVPSVTDGEKDKQIDG